MPTNTNESGFHALNVAPELCTRLEEAGIIVPTPIQAKAIPIASEGHDLIGVAQTGTGKTLAFGLPIKARLQPWHPALVLAPTRELAQQISETLSNIGLKCALIVGGASMQRQVKDIRTKPNVFVATPGRLIDHLQQHTIKLNKVSIVVLDEADRMLDMGFAPSIKTILDQTPQDRQTMLFSATLPQEIADLASEYLREPKTVEVDRSGMASELVEQELLYITHDEKPMALTEILYVNKGTVLIFTRTRFGAAKLAKSIRKDGHTSADIHSDRTLAQRREALQGFKDGRYRILVATDIASRGIDVKEISLVVNYDVPEQADDYIHRIGRTGRAGVEGRAITLARPDQANYIREIEKLLGTSIPVSPNSTALPKAAKPRSRGSRKDRFSDKIGTVQPSEPMGRRTKDKPKSFGSSESDARRPKDRPRFGDKPSTAPSSDSATRPSKDRPRFSDTVGRGPSHFAKRDNRSEGRDKQQGPERVDGRTGHRGWSGRPKRRRK